MGTIQKLIDGTLSKLKKGCWDPVKIEEGVQVSAWFRGIAFQVKAW